MAFQPSLASPAVSATTATVATTGMAATAAVQPAGFPADSLRPDEGRGRHLGVVAAAVVLQAGVFAWDVLTPLGRTEWVFHLLPIVLLLLQPWAWSPVVLGLSGAGAVMLGRALSANTLNVNAQLAFENRLMGCVCLLVVALVVHLTLRQRRLTRRVLWVQQGKVALGQQVVGDGSPEQVGARMAAGLCAVTGATHGAVYRVVPEGLRLSGHHGAEANSLPALLPAGSGLLAQAVADTRVHWVGPVPDGHLALRTALGRSTPAHLMLLPLRAEGQPVGVVELAFLGPVDAPLLNDLGHRAVELLGLALRAAVYRQELRALLEESQRQAEELQVQQEELRVNNEELEEQGRLLRESQAALEAEHHQLTQANAQLEIQTQSLAQQKAALQRAQIDLQQQADHLAAASRYKSEFLANMSHELRTPLNSALILSKLLVDNRGGTLTAEQVKYAQAIHASNSDLLTLINDILDLAKVESGHAELRQETVRLADLVARLRATFEPLARDKGLALSLTLADDLPPTLTTDGQRLQQVLKNLLANAVKFTAQGRVAMRVRREGSERLRFDVVDTGLGIPADKHEVIFEAFRQADGSTSRQYGGTGLGLSISRELVQRLGGQIGLCSTPGEGSTFSVVLPLVAPAAAGADAVHAPVAHTGPATARPLGSGAVPGAAAGVASAGPEAVPASAPAPAAAGGAPGGAAGPAALAADVQAASHAAGASGRRVLLAVEDDPRFAEVLRALVQDMGFECLVAATGEQALAVARAQPLAGILLDVGLPDQSGFGVLERLKSDPATRHVPVHVVSSVERTPAALALGAVGHAVKPVQREQLVEAVRLLERKLVQPMRRVLVVEDDPGLRGSLRALLSAPQVQIDMAATLAEALALLEAHSYDCVVTDLSLPDGNGDELLARLSAAQDSGGAPPPPVIVYTGRALSRDEEARLRRHSRSIIVKGARSPERLLDEVTLFLHSVESQLPDDQRRMLSLARERDTVLEGRTILLAEDDVRNIFALTSVFEPKGVRLRVARNGREAVEAVRQHADIDLVLMDVMMPEMDGLAATRAIRALPEGAELPVIALTAKAMADDRQQCLAAGANDYLAKPIDAQRLLSLCRVWMSP